MANEEQSHNIAVIRRLLTESFTPEGLRRFCLDHPTFRPIDSEFGPGLGLDDMVDRVIDYCRTQLLWDELFVKVKQTNPHQYARFEPQLGLPQPLTLHRVQADEPIEQERAREAAIQLYLDRMGELLEDGLRESGQDDARRSIARARTLTVLRVLDGERRGLVLQFLYESGLVVEETDGVEDRTGAVVDLRGANASEAKLRSADLGGINLSGADLNRAILFQANLERANLRQTDLSETNLYGALLREADMQDASMHSADLGRADLSRAILRGSDLGAASLQEADLSGADLTGANLREARLNGADLVGSNLGEADLSGADLTGANLREAKLDGADLLEADLTKANLQGATVAHAQLERAASLEGMIWPDGGIVL